MLKLIIFDMDGLMFATEQVNYRAFTEIVKEEGYNPTFEQYIGFLGMNAKDIQKKYYVYYGEDVDAEGIYKKVGNRSKQIIREEGVPEKEGLRELLQVVREKGLQTAVASGSDTDVIKEYLDRTGLNEYFDMVLSLPSSPSSSFKYLSYSGFFSVISFVIANVLSVFCSVKETVISPS